MDWIFGSESDSKKNDIPSPDTILIVNKSDIDFNFYTKSEDRYTEVCRIKSKSKANISQKIEYVSGAYTDDFKYLLDEIKDIEIIVVERSHTKFFISVEVKDGEILISDTRYFSFLKLENRSSVTLTIYNHDRTFNFVLPNSYFESYSTVKRILDNRGNILAMYIDSRTICKNSDSCLTSLSEVKLSESITKVIVEDNKV